MTKRRWTIEKVEETVIEVGGYGNNLKPRELELLKDDITEFFEEHTKFKGFWADIVEKKIDICPLCGHEYEPDWDSVLNREICAFCGAKEEDYMMRKLE